MPHLKCLAFWCCIKTFSSSNSRSQYQHQGRRTCLFFFFAIVMCRRCCRREKRHARVLIVNKQGLVIFRSTHVHVININMIDDVDNCALLRCRPHNVHHNTANRKRPRRAKYNITSVGPLCWRRRLSVFCASVRIWLSHGIAPHISVGTHTALAFRSSLHLQRKILRNNLALRL
jgi:hypothetical protein